LCFSKHINRLKKSKKNFKKTKKKFKKAKKKNNFSLLFFAGFANYPAHTIINI
jgi:50S ribosomal subunit-associated GTPase HflX